MRLASYITISLFLGLIAPATQAFTLSNSGRVYFPDPEIDIVVAGNTCSTAGFNSAEELSAMVEESVNEYWNRIPTCALKLNVTGVDSSIDTTSDTLLEAIGKISAGKIIVGCSDDTSELFTSAGILGVGSINTANGDRGVLLINNADTSFANLDNQEKLATIAHEIGHAFGLGHSSDEAALMYYSIGNKVQEKLSMDDYDACTYLYPHSSPGSCSSISMIDKDDDFTGGGSGPLVLNFLMGLSLMLGLGFLKKKSSSFKSRA